MKQFTRSLVFSLALSGGWYALEPACLQADDGFHFRAPLTVTNPSPGMAPGGLLSQLLPNSRNPIIPLQIEPQLRFSAAPYRSSYGASQATAGKNRMDPHSREAAPLPPPTPPVDMRETVATDQFYQAAEQRQTGIASPGRSAPSTREPMESVAVPVASPQPALEAIEVQVLHPPGPRPAALPAFVPRLQPTPGNGPASGRHTTPHCAARS